MKVMIDTNVLVSAVYNPDSKPAHAVRDVCENHELLLCDQIVAECYDVSLDLERPKVLTPA